MKLRKLMEEFVDYIDKTGDFPIFINPTKKELNQTSPYDKIRFIVYTNSKTLLVGDGYKHIHSQIAKKAGERYEKELKQMYDTKDLQFVGFTGVAEKKGNRWVIISSDHLEYIKYIYKDRKKFGEEKEKKIMNYINNFKNYDYSWVDKSISVSPYIKNLLKDK